MFGIILTLLLPTALYAAARPGTPNSAKLFNVLLLAYAARILFQLGLANVPVFSYGAGGDWELYEAHGQQLARYWEQTGVHFVTSDELDILGHAALPANIYGFVYYLNGGEVTRVGATALLAVAACLTCLQIHSLALMLGADPTKAFRVLCVLLFGPAFVLYTSATYKDGLVLFFVVTAFAAAVRLTRRLSLLQIVVGALACLGLYYCRFYLIFVVLTPLVIGTVGVGGKSPIRPILATLASVALLLFLLSFTTILEDVRGSATNAYAIGTNDNTAASNAQGGSGVIFDDGGEATGALHLKLLYTIFAPFPWQAGSIALQLGKIEALVWYYFIYRAIIAGRRLWKEDRTLLMIFVAFLVPTTVMYSLIMTNVGLIVRERLPVVFVATLLATLSWKKSDVPVTEQSPIAKLEPRERLLAARRRRARA